ncbi:MAG: NAD(P)/FAD-dependent oxidoreductase [Opitutaceae bacterium]
MDFDLVVIGGGPCGSTAATFAKQAGMSVVLVEKDAFPRFHIGESLLPAGNALMRRSGVWSKVLQAGFIVKTGARFCIADGASEKRIDFSDGIIPVDATFQVERAKFDGILLDHARREGVDARQGWKVTALEQSPDDVTVTIQSAAGERQVIRARWCIDAGGRENHYPSELKSRMDAPPLTPRVAVYSHFKYVFRTPGPEGGDTIVVRLEDGWFWVIPISEEITSMGLVTTTGAMRAGGRDPEEVFRKAVADSPFLRERFVHAVPVMGFRVTADYSYFRKELARGRVVLAGDAGGFFDPIFSSGVYMGLWGASEAVALIARAHAAGRALTPRECARYAAKVKRHAGVFGKLIRAFYDNASFWVFMTPRPPLDIEPGINSVVAGHATMTWPLRWRLCLFFAACWLSRCFWLLRARAINARVRDAGAAPG